MSAKDDYIGEERMSTKDDYYTISHPGVNITAHAYIKELEEQNKEMLEILIETVKDYSAIGWGCNDEWMANLVDTIEKATGLKIEEILKEN